MPDYKLIFTFVISFFLVACGGSNSENPPSANSNSECDINYSTSEFYYPIASDPILSDQWYFSNTTREDINVADAWMITKGQGVIVAVIDDAVELTHQDLKQNVVYGSISFRPNNKTGLPYPCSKEKDTHGTAVAGLILGRDNNGVGISGVAPRASLIAYDVLSTNLELDLYKALTIDNQRVSIYHNSWGSPDTGTIRKSGSYFELAIKQGIEQGRNSLGNIFVFAGGNGGGFDNTNLDGFINKLGIISVCAVDERGFKTSFSEPGSNLLVCAPGYGNQKGIYTTGLNNTYRNDFFGTSASAPLVTGTIALILSIRPDLSWRDVQLILAQSARKNDPFNSGWRPAKGGSGWVHPFYGYGVVDTTAAVKLAQSWKTVGRSLEQKKCDSGLISVNQLIPDLSYFFVKNSFKLNCSNITAIEFVEIEITTNHPNDGELKIEIETAEGNSSVLTDARICKTNLSNSCGEYKSFRFGSIHHLGESANGIWSLKISDLKQENAGTLESWRLIVHGR